METPVVRSRGRPRKRRREDTQSEELRLKSSGDDVKGVGKNVDDKEGAQIVGNARKKGRPPKRRLVESRGEAMVGRYVMKEFDGSGVFIGKIASYDTGLYRVEYEDGDCEDFDSCELREYLVGNEGEMFVGDLLERRKKLDEYVAKKVCAKLVDGLTKRKDVNLADRLETADMAEPTLGTEEKDVGNLQHDTMKIELPASSELSCGEVDGSEVDDDDADSSSDSCEYGLGWEMRSETEIPAVPPPELPPSSANIGVPVEYVSHLFSVYGFLRSFSIQLFLSPFTLDDFVGCLNCKVPSSLLDFIHVALLRALRRHLERLASDGSELASKCLRCIDWGLLDMLTWPVYLVHYLMIMDHLDGEEWKGFYANVLEKDYCTLSVGMKLTVLQILCDDALDNAEIRAEIDMREESEVGIDPDGFTSLESVPRKAYPRHCKSYFGKDRGIANVDAQNVFLFGSSSLTVKGNDHNRDTADADKDENVDECRLCGMDGMLLCCDGCPSAYHSRCIGVNKLSIPGGKWFCHECTINRLGPAITVGTSLKGAEVFGVDSYVQLFLGTCDHLLVLKVSVKTSPFVRYYHSKDIVKVVRALCSTPHHAALYMRICEAILKYWRLPQSVIPPLLNSQTSMSLENTGETAVVPTQVQPFGENGRHELHRSVELENHASGPGGGLIDNGSGSSIEKLNLKCSLGGVSLGVPVETDYASMVGVSGATTAQNPTNVISKLHETDEPSCFVQGLADISSIAGNISCISGNSGSSAGHSNGVLLPENFYMHGKEDTDVVSGQTNKKGKNTGLYMGSLFKTHGYINHFVHGDYAASAAANFASLLSDENQLSEVHASDPRKVMAANVALQSKAIASAAVRFFWPSTEKKLTEIPRERCSWCFHCKAPIASRKACLLNQAALNATKAAMKFFLSCRTKNVEGGLYSIVIYTLYMEESLRGLILGPFRSEDYRKKWCKNVEQASTCSDMKSLILELEGNLSTLALSSEWTKMVDNWMDESSVPQSACPTGSTLKRGPGRRRKHLIAVEATSDDSNDNSSDISWWRGGKFAKLVFQRATLSSSVLKKAARQGGSRRIPGVHYADGSDVPKRSRQLIWRAAVEMAKNASQLALQVRYLDHHVKWSDLVRPEQTIQDGKGAESDSSVFRNAVICDKKVVENKISYGAAFGHQKHLSTRFMKSVIEKEEGQDGKDIYWFFETRVPLYLIKDYEEKTGETLLLPPKETLKESPYGSFSLSKLQRKQLKAFRRNALHYLYCKMEKSFFCHCASCHQEVKIDFVATCTVCEGYCHKDCTLSSTVPTDEDVEFVTICKKCSDVKAVSQNNCIVDSPTSPLVLQGQEYQNSATATRTAKSKNGGQHQNSATASKSTRLKGNSRQSPSCGTSETPSEKNSSLSGSHMTKSKKRPCHWGLIWKKKDPVDGSEFRSKNILDRGNLHGGNASGPECHSCKKPYNPNLIYISCEACHHWYHADAVELDESKIPKLLGFKCCRCRRIKTPICPYADPDPNPKKARSDPDSKKIPVRKLLIRGPKGESAAAPSVSEATTMSEHVESIPSTPMSAMEDDIFIQVDDPLLLSVSDVEQMAEPNSELDFEWNAPLGPAPQKLPVRRQTKNENENDDEYDGNPSFVQSPTLFQTNNGANPPHAEWDVSNGGFDNGMTFDDDNFNFENTEYEPQTYFSFTELLEADEGNMFQEVGAPEGTCYNWPCENSSTGFLEQCEVGSTFENVPCNICSETEPAPDLSCQNCGSKIHSQCSPGEELSHGGSWSCGSCRGWR